VKRVLEIVIRETAAEGPHGPIPVRIYSPAEGGVSPGLVWNHGGGFAFGDLDMPEADWVSRSLAERGIVVVSVFYRLAVDGVRYPVPSDDVVAAFRWVAAHAAELGIDPARLSLGGASAGGNLAAGATLRLRDEGDVLPDRVVLAYPVLHAELPPLSTELTDATSALAEESRFSPERVRSMNLSYAGSESMLFDRYAFPANADPTGHPPVLILNSEADTLRASGEAYAALLVTHGVTVRSQYEPGTEHGHLNRPDEAAAQRSIQRIVSWLTTESLDTATVTR
jgi:acetyl esterase/lipase